MKKVYLNEQISKRIFLIFFLFATGFGAFAQCPTAPTPCTSVTGTTTINLTAGQNACISGAYTGNISGISSTSTLYIEEGATFTPSSINGFAGRIRNCGTANLPGFSFAATGTDSARLENYGTATIAGTIQYNSNNIFINGRNAKLVFSNSQNLNNSRIYNKGSIKINGGLTTNGANVIIYNEDSLTTTGDITLNGKILNTGYLFANGGLMKLNANGTITNGCYFVSQGSFEYNGSSTDPLIVTGFIWAKGAEVKTNGSGLLVLQGDDAFLQGNNFNSDGTVRGKGNFYFSGTTKNQGSFGADGTPAAHLNFFDATKTGTVFDQGNQPPVANNVTTDVLSPKDNTSFVPGTCSDIIKEQYCDVVGGPNVSACNISTADLPDAKAAQTWSFLPGPSVATATINATTGVVTGMNTAGDYYFLLYKPLLATCRDTVKVTRLGIPPVPKITSPLYVCQNATASLPDSATYVWYTVSSGGTGVTPAPTFSTATPTTLIYYVLRRVNGCESARVRLDVIINPSLTLSLAVRGDTICSTATADPNVTILNAQANVTYEARLGAANGTLLGTGTRTTNGNLVIAINRTLLGTAPSNNAVYFTATIPGCGTRTLTNTANVRVNLNPTLNLTVRGDTICSGGTVNPNVTILNGQAGVLYEARLNSVTGTLLGSGTPTANGNFVFAVNRLLLAAAPSNNTIYFTATIRGCGTQNMSITTNVRVNLNPTLTLAVRGDTICSNATVDPNVTILNAQTGVLYEARLGSVTGTLLGSGTPVANGNFTFVVNRTLLAAAPSNNPVYFTATIRGCGTQNLGNTANIRVNLNPTLTLAVRGDTICSNAATNPNVTILNAQAGVLYEARLNSVTGTLLGSGTPTTNGDFVFAINRMLLAAAPSNNTIFFAASIRGCGSQNMSNTANVRVNRNPTLSLAVRGDTICSNSATDPNVTILNAQSGVLYEAHLGSIGGTLLGSGTPTANGNFVFAVNRALLAAAPSNNQIHFTATIKGCGTQNLSNTANIRVNKLPSDLLILTASPSPICLGGISSISVVGGEAGVTYSIFDSTAQIGTLVGNASKLFSFTTVGTHIISAKANIAKCGTVDLKDTATVVVNKLPSAGVTVVATSPVCINGTTTVTILASEKGVVYTISDGTTLLGTILGTGVDASGTFAMNTAGTRTINVRATIGGCTTVTIVSAPKVVVNPVPNKTLTVTATSPVCQNLSSTISISRSENGIKYRIYDGTTGVDELLDSIMGTGSLTVPASKAVVMSRVGLRTIVVKAEVGGCAVVVLDSKPQVQVNPGSDVALGVTATSPICFGDTSVVRVSNAQSGVIYQVLEGNNILAPSKTGVGADLFFNIINLSLGSHTLTVNATTGGCSSVPLDTHPVVLVNPKPNDTNLQLTGSTVCSNTDTANVTVRNTQAGVSYQAIVAGGPVGRPVTSPAANATIILRLPVSALQLGTNTISISGTIGGCGTINFTKTTTVIKNQLPDPTSWSLVGDTICANSDSAYVVIGNTQTGVRYQASLKGVLVGSSKISTGAPVTVGIPRSALQLGTNFLHVVGSIAGCGSLTSADSALVLVNPLPNINLAVQGDTVCSNSSSAEFTIKNTLKGQVFQAYWKKTPIGLPGTSTADGQNVVLSLPVSVLGVGNHYISSTVSVGGCTTVFLKDSALVIVNQLPSNNPTIVGDTICSDSTLARIRLGNTQRGVTYGVFKNGVLVGSGLATGTTLSITINAIGFSTGANILDLKASIAGCDVVDISGKANVFVNPRPNYSLLFTASGPVCIGGFSTVTIANSERNVTYTILENGQALDTLWGNGKNASKQVSMQNLGDRIITIRATINGCSDGLLTGKDTVTVNTGSDTKLNVTATSPVCVGAPISVSIPSSDPAAVYKVMIGNVVVSDSLQGTGNTVVLTIDSLSAGIYDLLIRATTGGCGIFQLEKQPRVVVDDKLDAGLKVIGDTVCSNTDSATVTIKGVKKRQIYSAFLNGTKLAEDSVESDGDFVLYVLVKDLREGLNKINIRASVGGCGSINLRDSASVLVNRKPDVNLSMTDDTVCRNSVYAQVEVAGTRAGETYYAYLNDIHPMDTVLSNGGNIYLTIPVDSLATGLNKISIGVFIKGCGLQIINGNSFIIVNPLPADTFAVIGDTVCSGKDFAQVTIKSTLVNQVFQAYDENDRPIGLPKKSLGGDVVLDIPVFGTLEKGTYKLSIKATIRGCDSTLLKNKADLLINDAPKPTLTVIGDTVCTNSDTATVKILGTQISESYVARINGVTISDSVISAGGIVTLKIPVSKLPRDTNVVTIYTNVIGCGEAPLSNAAWIIINKLPTDTLKVQGDTVCENATEAVVKISSTTKDVVYSAWLNGKQIGTPVTSTGGDVFLNLPISTLSLDTNKVSFLASIHGCADVPLKDSALVIVNKKPESSLSLAGSIVCSNSDTATVTIFQTNKGAIYQALLNGTLLGEPRVGTGADITLKLPVTQLGLDTNQVAVVVSVSGCSNDTLDRKADVVVNRLPSDSLSTDGSTVCTSAVLATVTVHNTQKNVGYQAYINNDTVGVVVISNGGTIELPVFVNQLQKGVNKIVVKTSLEKCNVITLKDTALVIVNDSPQADSVLVDGSSVCRGQDAFATLSKTQKGVTYNLYLNGSPTAFQIVGTGKSDTLRVPYNPNDPNQLKPGGNLISFTADIQSCNTTNIKDTDFIYVLSNPNFSVQGDNWLCYSDTGFYGTNGIQGALSYHWVVGDSAFILSGQRTQNIAVRFDSINSSVSVMPVGNFGVCRQDSVGLFVTIKAPITGQAFVTGKDTLCVGEVDTIQVIHQKGVDYYGYKLPFGVELVATLRSDSASDSLIVRYTRAGLQKLVFYPYSTCARKFIDSIVREVRILGIPIAEANEYDLPEMIGTLSAIALNGRGSAVGDTVSYKWYTEKKPGTYIETPTSLNGATLTTSEKEVKVFLTVTNVNGYCPATDSAIIRPNFDIDVPNVFSPNNDGTHDVWEIKNISTFYPNTVVEVFNKWGSVVWKSDVGYRQPWDGTRNGEEMPVATYYYVLDKKNGTKPKVGSVTIIR